MVHMKGVDLAQFQFDYDLTWAAVFINADGTVYGRYGSRSVEGPMVYNSLASLKKAMARVLQLHRNYPANQASLLAKNRPVPKWKQAQEIPGLRSRMQKQLNQAVGPRNCIHCHNIYDGWRNTAYDQGTFSTDDLWVYPLPENIGLQIEVEEGNMIAVVEPNSAAALADLQAGDRIQAANGQPIISIADLQWVLNGLPTVAELQLTIEREGQSLQRTVFLTGNWRQTDISWRASMWSLRPRVGIHAPEISVEEKRELGLAPTDMALKAKWIPNQGAKRAGLRDGDIIVEVAGNRQAMSTAQFNLFIRLNYRSGVRVPVKILRQGQPLSLELPIPPPVE